VLTVVEMEEESAPMDSGLASPNLFAWLKELRALPANDPSWIEIDAFIAAVQGIAESKRQEIQSRASAQAAMEELQKSYAGLIEYFGYTSLLAFKVDDVPDERLSACKNAIDDLAESFRKRQLISDERCTTYAADRDRYNRLFAEDNRIGELYAMLDALITKSGPEPGGSKPEAEEGTEEPGFTGTITSEPAAVAPSELPPETSEAGSKSGFATTPACVESPVSEPSTAENKMQITTAAARVADTELDVAVAVIEAPLPQEAPPITLVPLPDIPAIEGAGFYADDGAPAQVTDPPAAEPHAQVATAPSETSRAVAVQVQEGHALLWSFIEANDLSLAYWLASSRSARGEEPGIPHSLIGMLIGSRLIESSEDPIIEEMRGLVTEYALTEASHPLLEVAAALRPAVLAPTLEVRTWTRIPSGLPTVRKLSETLLAFSESNLVFSPQDVTGAVEQSTVQLALANARQTLEEWLEDAPQRRMVYPPATEVWRKLCEPKGELEALVRSATESTTTVGLLREKVDQWQNPAYRNRQVDQLCSKRIDDFHRQALLRNIEETAGMLTAWCDAAEDVTRATVDSDGSREQFAALRTQISHLIGPLQSELTRAITDSSPGPARTALRCLINSISNLAELFRLFYEKPEQPQFLAWDVKRCRDLRSTIAQGLVSYYELDLGSDGEPTNLQEVEPAFLAARSECRTPAQVIEGWIRRDDYRFVPQLLERTSENESAAMRQRFESQLADRLSETRKRLEQSYLDNITDENKRTDLEAELFGIKPESAIANPYYAKIQKVSDQLDQAELRKNNERSSSGSRFHRLRSWLGADLPPVNDPPKQ
jgi:hypothetical protein